jgi:urease alpha subunit
VQFGGLTVTGVLANNGARARLVWRAGEPRMKLDTIIADGQLVTADGVVRADLGIRGEKIAALGPRLAARCRGAEVIDADRKSTRLNSSH